MNKLKQRIRSFKSILAIGAAILCSISAWADVTVDQLKYTINNNSATITGVKSGVTPSGALNIPSVIGADNTPVTAIAINAFKGCDRITSVNIPDSVTSVGYGAFANCTLLRTVHTGDGLTILTGALSYGSYASGSGLFSGCVALKEVSIGEKVKTIGYGCFYDCSSLLSITIPSNVTKVEEAAFENCEKLDTVVFSGTGVETIERYAFKGCALLKTLSLGTTVSYIGVGAFDGCARLRNVTLPEGLDTIGEFAFRGCAAMTSLTLPDSLAEIGYGAFTGCTALTDLDTGDGLTELTGALSYGSYASGTGLFSGCTSLKNVTIGKKVQTIGYGCFYGCSSLKTITVPDNVETIQRNAFTGCTYLETVTIGNGVRDIEYAAFSGLANLKNVTFGTSVTVIGESVFDGCSLLRNVTLPEGLDTIGEFAFRGCAAMTSLTLPDSLAEIGYGAFTGCTALTDLDTGDGLTELTGALSYGSYASGTGLFSGCTSLKNVTIGKKVQTIGYGCFYGCSSLKTITIPDNVMTIQRNAFTGCASLTTVFIGGGVTDIEYRAFSDNNSLKTVELGKSVDSIASEVFANCGALHYVTFKGTAAPTDVGANIFKGAKSRMTVYVTPSSTGWIELYQAGLPSDGKWQGVNITYAPPPEGAGNPYDFYPCVLIDRVSYKDYVWPSPVLLTTNRYVNGRTIPTTCATIREGSPIYLSCAFDEYWRGEAFTVTNRFTLSGAKSGTFDYKHRAEAHGSYPALYETNATPALLQNLAPGNYTLTLKMNVDNRLPETDYANNTTSITFTIVAVPKYKVSFNLNGASGTAPVARTVYEGRTIGELPTVTAPAGWTFLGWYTAATGGTKITSSQIINSAQTYYAHWSKCDMGFYTPSSDKGWSQPLFVATSGSAVSGKTQFKKGERIYVKYAFANLAGNYDLRGFINRFTLTGAKSTTFDNDWSDETLIGGKYGYDEGAPSALQNLPAGTYTLTCTLDVTGVISETNEGNNTRSITFTVVADDTPPPPPPPPPLPIKPELGSVAGDELVGTVPENAASVYDGYLYLDNVVMGTIQAKVSKPKLNKKLGVTTAKTSVAIQVTGEKKVTLKGELDLNIGEFTITDKKSDRELNLKLGIDGITGTFGKYEIDGARNFFDSKDKSEKSDAEEILKPYLGAYSMICDGGILSVNIAKKGKVTVKGAIDGNKVSAKAQVLIGEEMICIPVIYSKKSVNLAFTIWLPIDGSNAEVIGLGDNAIIGKAGTLKNGAQFIIDGDIGASIETEDERTLELLPDNETITVSKSKWLVADGIKPAKVAYKKGEFTITEGKKGAGIVNPSGLKLSYKSKDGSFTGSFTAYAIVKGKLKKHKATVEGILIGDVGYGTITINKVGTWAVTIE